MAVKTGGGNLLVDKGEKIGLGIAAVIGVGLLALGLMSAVDRPQDPDEFAGALEKKASALNSQMNAPTATIEDVPEAMKKPAVATAIPVTPNPHAVFDPTTPPDPRRITP